MTTEPFLALEAEEQRSQSARQTEHGQGGAASVSKGFRRLGPREQKAMATGLQDWDGENSLP